MLLPLIVNLDTAPSILELIEAMGVIIALMAVAISLIQLVRKDKDKQQQINSLANLAEESKNQTLIFQSQLEKMEDSNELWKEHLEKITLLIASSQEFAQIQSEQALHAQNQRRADIKPRIVLRGGTAHRNTGSLKFMNVGELGIIKRVIPGEKNDIRILNEEDLINRELETGRAYSFEWAGKVESPSVFHNYFDIQVIIEDNTGFQYIFNLTGKGNHAKCSRLKEYVQKTDSTE